MVRYAWVWWLATAAVGGASAISAAENSLAAKGEVVDLRPRFDRWKLERRVQGGRGTCSVFAVAGALEFAAAEKQGTGRRLSVEFLNWASNQACGEPADGGFFSDLWKGYEAYGICRESEMPYQAAYDAARRPSESALAEAKQQLGLRLELHWIKRWNVETGLSPEEFAAIRARLKEGTPVCAGLRWPKQERWENDVLQMCGPAEVRDGHSVLLVGYREGPDPARDGVFIFRNSGGNGTDGFMPYAYARAYMNDAVWIR